MARFPPNSTRTPSGATRQPKSCRPRGRGRGFDPRGRRTRPSRPLAGPNRRAAPVRSAAPPPCRRVRCRRAGSRLFAAPAYALVQDLRLRVGPTARGRTLAMWLGDRLLKLGAHVPPVRSLSRLAPAERHALPRRLVLVGAGSHSLSEQPLDVRHNRPPRHLSNPACGRIEVVGNNLTRSCCRSPTASLSSCLARWARSCETPRIPPTVLTADGERVQASLLVTRRLDISGSGQHNALVCLRANR